MNFKKLYIALFLCVPALLFGQTKKGFKLLDKGKYEAAQKCFQRDLQHAEYASAAYFGLNRIYMRYHKKNYDSLMVVNQMLRTGASMYNLLNDKQQEKYKKFNINAVSWTKSLRTVQLEAFKCSNRTEYADRQNAFVGDFAPLDKVVQKKVELREREVQKKMEAREQEKVKEKLDNIESLSYDELNDLVQNHSDLLTRKSLKFKNVINNQLYATFIDEYGYDELDRFAKEQPQHWVAQECWVNEFAAAMKTQDQKALIQFLQDHPMTLFDDITERMIAYLPSSSSTLSEAEKDLIEAAKLKTEIAFSLHTSRAAKNDKLADQVIQYAKATAPAQRAYSLVKRVIQYYLKAKRWETVSHITQQTQHLFPDEQPENCASNFAYYHNKEDWYETAIEIFSRPTDTILLTPIVELNSSANNESSPIVTLDGKGLYFAADGRSDGIGGTDIYKSTFNTETGKWNEPILQRGLSTAADEAPLSLTSNGRKMLLFREGKLYVSYVVPNGWSKPKPLADAINSFGWIGRAVLSSDGKTLIFAASNDVEEAYYNPKIDLYVARLNRSGEFGQPFSIGSTINTPNGQERSPFLHANSKTIYFSSDGHGGLGGTDIFVSERLDDSWTKWSTPQNLGKEINTLEDDWGYNLSMSGASNIAYISSDEFSRRGQSDLYSTGIPEYAQAKEKVRAISGKLKSSENIGPNTKIVLYDSETKEVVGEVTPLPDGTFMLPIGIDIKSVYYQVVGTQVFPIEGTLDLEGKGEVVEVAAPMEMVTEKDVKAGNVKIEHLLFESGKSNLRPKSKAILVKLYDLIKEEEDLHIKVNGHTDNEGGVNQNFVISRARAAIVKQELIELGIPEKRIRTQGFGFTAPINTNDTEAGRAQNRRVELQLVKKDF